MPTRRKQLAVTGHGVDSVSAEAVRDSLQALLGSRLFEGSESSSRLLRHVVAQTLDGHADRLKEYTLGVDVLGRPASFDPRTDAVVRIQASRLRAKLAAYYSSEGASAPVRIELPRGGYVPTFRPAPRVRFPWTFGRKEAVLLLGAIVLLIISVAWWPRRTTPIGNAGTRQQPTRIAVLPFQSFNAGKDFERFSEQVTSEVMSTLTRVPGLRLVGRSSVLHLKTHNTGAQEVGRKLNVEAIVEGNVRMIGNHTRVAAQLVSSRDGFQIWSQTFERPSDEAFAIPEEVGRAISYALNLPPPGESASWTHRGRDFEAYKLVLKARYLEPTTPDTAETRIGYYSDAIGRDPGYVAPWIGMADTWCRLGNAAAQPPREVMEKARHAVAKALQLDDTHPEAHFLAASISWSYDWNWTAADREFRRAIQLDPSSATTRGFYAQYLAHMGRFDEAFAQLELLRALEPVAAASSDVVASVLYLNRQYDRTIQFCESALSSNPTAWPLYYWLGRAYGSTGRLKESAANLQKLHPSGEIGGRGFGMLGATFARLGRRGDASKLLAKAGDRARRAYVSPVSVAQVYVGLGDYHRAFEWLEKGYRERDEAMTALKVEPAHDPIRGDPRFQDLLRRLNLE